MAVPRGMLPAIIIFAVPRGMLPAIKKNGTMFHVKSYIVANQDIIVSRET
jgi:hypothetical protein